MGWKGFVRAIEADMRRAARDADRRDKLISKQREQREAEQIVAKYQAYLEQITSLHRASSSTPVNWSSVAREAAPSKPRRSNDREVEARQAHRRYRPSFLDRLLRRQEKQLESLRHGVAEAASRDEKDHDERLNRHKQAVMGWKGKRALAERILRNEPRAFLDAIRELSPLAAIENLGTNLNFAIDDTCNLTGNIRVHGNEVIPSEKYTLRKSGTLSTRQMPQGEFNLIYQDYVCGAVLRVAAELFALLPIERLLLNATDMRVNSSTGHLEEQSILSVLIVRATFEGLNLANVDPSDAMDNFLHKMQFKRLSGFRVVKPLSYDELA
jgi:hypothetical protein